MIPPPPGGKLNKSNVNGQSFQTRLELTFLGYGSAGIATIEKVDPPIKVVGTRPNVKTFMMPNPWLDFVGTWHTQGGRMIQLEAKSTIDDRLPIDVKSGGVTESQVKAIRRWHAARAAVAVVWHFENQVKIATAMDIILALQHGARSIKWKHLPAVSRGMGLIEFDILGELEQRVDRFVHT